MHSRLLVGCVLVICASSDAFGSWAEKCMKPKVTCVNITVDPTGSITLDDPVAIVNPTSGSKQKIIWKLPEGYVFNFNGGKVELKETPADEFQLWAPLPDDDDESDTAGWSKRYKVLVKKRLVNPNGYKYKLTFHELNGGKPTRKFACDPVIANSDSTAKRAKLAAPFPCTVTNE